MKIELLVTLEVEDCDEAVQSSGCQLKFAALHSVIASLKQSEGNGFQSSSAMKVSILVKNVKVAKMNTLTKITRAEAREKFMRNEEFYLATKSEWPTTPQEWHPVCIKGFDWAISLPEFKFEGKRPDGLFNLIRDRYERLCSDLLDFYVLSE